VPSLIRFEVQVPSLVDASFVDVNLESFRSD
jgi:hypothetical protein